MRFCVNADCIGCGLCEHICPGVFSMTEKGTAKAAPEEVPGSDENAVMEAIQGCPVSAIEQQ